MGPRVGFVALCLLTHPALACLPGESVFMSCTIQESGERLEVCSTASDVTYRFGPPDRAPDLELSVPLPDAKYEPWSGVGRAISEGISFQNERYTYEVYAGFNRRLEDEDANAPRSFGGVRVRRDGAPLLQAICLPQTVTFTWSADLWDQMHDFGLRWDYGLRAWHAAR